MSKIISAALLRLCLPLQTPYRLSYRTFEEFEPYVVIVADDAGHMGISDGHISPGSSSETREGGWNFCSAFLGKSVGLDVAEAKSLVLASAAKSKVAATAIVTAMEVLEGHPLLEIPADHLLPLLTPTSAYEPDAITAEVETRIAEGYRCLKIKVGKDVDADLERVARYQAALAGRGTIRIDANRAYDREQAIRFASSLNPDGIELFEQPCDADDWDSNAAVAARSIVPLMLDEPICASSDIQRAATIKGVGFCKLKLKRFGSIDILARNLELVRDCGMRPVLGDGLGTDLHAWLEACVARVHIDNAGEFNGFLKCYDRLLAEPPQFVDGAMLLKKGVRPVLAPGVVSRLTVERLDFGAPTPL